jgi:GNAT superfamily N-acetyltransferase
VTDVDARRTGAYRVRHGRRADVPRLPEIERCAAARFHEVGLQPSLPLSLVSAAALAEAVDAGRLWVAVGRDDVPVGFALALVVDGCGYLHELDVLPEHGRRGVGAALVEAVCAWARRERFPAVTLITFRHVPFNAPFYARLGFRVLAPGELSAALAEILQAETERGIPDQDRVAMRRDV